MVVVSIPVRDVILNHNNHHTRDRECAEAQRPRKNAPASYINDSPVLWALVF